MSHALVILAEAEAEATEAAIWYEQRNNASAAKFLKEFRSTLEKLASNPFQYQVLEFEIRRAPIAGFPHGLLYAVSDEEIVVLSCFHGRRDPEKWRERLK